MINEQDNVIDLKVAKIIQELSTATGTQVFNAFLEAPTMNLQEMAKMIDFILTKRKEDQNCNCEIE